MQRAGGFKRGLADARLSLIGTGEDWGMSTSGSPLPGLPKHMLSGGLSTLPSVHKSALTALTCVLCPLAGLERLGHHY